MRSPAAPQGALPRVWAIAQRDLRQLIADIAAEFADQANLRVLDKPLDEAVSASRELAERGELDAVLCAGALAERLQRELTAPVISVTVSGIDLLRALKSVGETDEPILVVTHRSTTWAADEFASLLRVRLQQRTYADYDDARRLIQQARRDRIKVVVGPSIVVQAAERLGMRGVLLHSEESVRDAMREAVTAARVRRIEDARRRRLDAIFRHLREGVMAVDEHQQIELVNPAMADLLGISAEWAIGRPLASLASGVDVEETMRTGTPDLERVQLLRNKMVLLSRIPIRSAGGPAGVVVTYQDATDIQRAERSIRSKLRSRALTTRYRLDHIIGNSTSIGRVVTLARQFAASDSTVLISGESGTGKEMFAQGIHAASRRSRHAFVAINCAALPESLLESELFGYEEGAFTGSRRGGKAGLIELAHGGTLFLDEIGDMPISLQTRLLRVLQEREVMRLGAADAIPVDVRVIAATHRDLKGMKQAGTFREDLYYRLNILHLDVPPLRDRQDDIPLLVQAFVAQTTKRMSASRTQSAGHWRPLLPALQRYDWPGNIRELENIVERIALLIEQPGEAGDWNARVRDLAPELFEENAGTVVDASSEERERLTRALRRFGGSRERAAAALGISRTTLWRKLRRLHVQA